MTKKKGFNKKESKRGRSIIRHILEHIGSKGPKYFNELCRELEGKVSRRTIYKDLVIAERQRLVSSKLTRSQFTEKQDIEIYRWVKRYGLTAKGRQYLKN